MKNRDVQILDMLARDGRVEVSRLADALAVSQVTIRKDLDALEAKGLLQREHGFAALCSRDDINNRLAVNYKVKCNIAQAAVELVQDGECVMIESGSSCALLAVQLLKQRKNISVITNSAFIADYIRRENSSKILLLGGEYQLESQVMVGPLLRKCVMDFHVDKLFIGADGFSEKDGFTGRDLARAEAVRDMAEQANRIVVLTDSSKFEQHGVVGLLPTERVDTVVTDQAIPRRVQSLLFQQGINLIEVAL